MLTVHVNCTSLTFLTIIFIGVKKPYETVPLIFYNATILNKHCFFQLTEINECLSSPCANDATCNDNVNSYTCTCADGYIGTNCENGISNLHRAVYICIINLYLCISQRCILFFSDVVHWSVKWAANVWLYSSWFKWVARKRNSYSLILVNIAIVRITTEHHKKVFVMVKERKAAYKLCR